MAERCTLIVLLFVFAAQANAQSPPSRENASARQALSGVVVDARTGQPLDGVVVEIVSPSAALLATTLSTTTDAEGRFRFDALAPGKYELHLSLVGYAFSKRDIEVAAGGNELRVPLSEGTTAYDEAVTVRGDLFGARESGVAGQQSLGSTELRQLGGMTLDDPLRAVQALAGVNAEDDFYSELTVRGHGFQHLNYRLDGMPAGFLMHAIKLIEDGGSISMINSDVLDHVTLLRGAYPQRDGRKLGAELEFASRDGSRQRARYNLTASGTSASMTAEGPIGSNARGSWLVSGRRSYLDVFLKQVLNDSGGIAFGFTDLFSKMVYDLSARHQVQATIVAGRSRLNRDAEVIGDPGGLGQAMHKGWMANAAWRHAISPRAVLTHRVFAVGESYRNDTDAAITVGRGRAGDLGYRADISLTPDANRLIEAGVSIERRRQEQQQDFRVPGWRILGGEDFARSTTSGGAYGQMHWTRGSVTITPGARADRFALTDSWTASPWLQVEWRRPAGISLVAGTGVYHQFPEIAQVAGRRGDAGLGPERAIDVDAGVEGRLGAATRWQVTGYNRTERDVIDLPGQYFQVVSGVLRAPSATTLYANRLNGSSRGIELMLQRKSPDALSGWIAYSYGHTRYTDRVTGEAFDGDFDQRHAVTVFGRYRVSDRMSVNARWRYGSNRPIVGYYRDAGGTFFVGSARNALRVPLYSRLDARFDRTYQWSARRVTLFAEVINVLNRENLRQVPPGINGRTGQVFDPLNTMFPIVPSVGVTVEF